MREAVAETGPRLLAPLQSLCSTRTRRTWRLSRAGHWPISKRIHASIRSQSLLTAGAGSRASRPLRLGTLRAGHGASQPRPLPIARERSSESRHVRRLSASQSGSGRVGFWSPVAAEAEAVLARRSSDDVVAAFVGHPSNLLRIDGGDHTVAFDDLAVNKDGIH
jgi:hypothetical protein